MLKLLWIIHLPIALIINWICSIPRILKRKMGNLCEAPEPPETKKWKQLFKYRQPLNKILLESGIKYITQWNSHGVSPATQNNFKHYLNRIDHTHQDLINYVKQYLTDDEVTDTFISGKFNRQIAVLENENALLKTEKLIQKDKYEEIIKQRALEFHELKRESKQKYSELQNYYQGIQQYGQHGGNNLEAIHIRKQLEETVKEQKTLIHQLQIELSIYQGKNTELMKKQAYDSDSSSKKLLNQNHMVQIENEKRKTKEQQQYLEQKHQAKLQSAQQEYQYKIQNLQRVLTEREEQLQKLHQQNKILQEQMSRFEATFNADWHKLEKNYISRGFSIDDLQHRLAIATNERDILKIKLSNFEQQNKEYESKIYTRETILNEQFKKQQQNEFLSQAGFIQDSHNVQENYIAQGELLQPLISRAHGQDGQFVNLQQEIEQQNYQIPNDEILKHNEQRNLMLESSQNRTEEPQGSQVTMENQNQKIQEGQQGHIDDSLGQIENIFENTTSLEYEVEEFSGTSEDRTFLHLQELLIRNIVKLDNVETHGNFDVRKRRKEVIQYIQGLLIKLKGKTVLQ